MEVPPGGVGQQHINNADHWRWIQQYAAEVGIPAQFLANALFVESGVGRGGQTYLSQYPPGGASNVRGIAQLATDTYPSLRDAQGNRIVTDPFNDEQAIRGMAYVMRNWGTGGPNINTPGTQSFDPERAVVFYNTRLRTAQNWEAGGRDNSTLPGATRVYLRNTGQGLTFGGGIGSDANIPLGQAPSALRATELDLQPPAPIDAQDFTAPLPYSAEADPTGRSLQDWLNNPIGGQRVAGLSTRAGYDLPQGAIEFLGQTGLTQLGGGPEAFPEGNFPWFTPGRISEDVGNVLQYHALMPNNLVFNPESQIWDVPSTQRFPGATGIWGAQRVADWLPTSGSGFEHDYLANLGYGAPPAGNLFAGNPYGNIGTLGMGNQGFGNIADMSTYGHQPFDYTQWFGALGTGGGGNVATFDERFRGDPTAGIFGGGGGGGGYPGLPPPGTYSGPGYPGSAILPPPGTYNFDPSAEGAGLGYEGSYGITTIDPGTAALGNAIDQNAQNMINQGYLQAYYANQQQAQHNQNMINVAAAPPPGPTPGFGLPTQYYGLEFTPS